VAQWVRSLDLTTHTSLSPIWHRFAPGFVNYKKGCTRLTAASDKVYQLLAHGWWFSPGNPASSTTKTGHHDIAEILSKVALKHQESKSEHILVINLINMVYEVKDLVRILTYRITLEHTLVINLINVVYVVKDLVRILSYRHTLLLEHILVINRINVMYVTGKGFSQNSVQ